MCRTIRCIHVMSGISAASLAALFGQFAQPGQEPEMNHGDFLKKAKESIELDIRASEIALGILEKKPEEGAKLVGLETLKPNDPAANVGIVTLATYELASGAYKILATDHLTQETVEHSTPNEHGLDGLMHAMHQEMVKRAAATLKAEAEAQAEATA